MKMRATKHYPSKGESEIITPIAQDNITVISEMSGVPDVISDPKYYS